MPISNRPSDASVAQTVEHALRAQVRTAALCIGLLLLVSLCGQLLAAARLESLATDTVPALLDARALTATLGAVHDEMTSGGEGTAHRARLDSLAERFHALARRTGSPSGNLVEARFAAYVDRTGTSADVDAEPTGSVDAASTYAALVALLDRQAAGAERLARDEFASTKLLQSLVSATLLLVSVIGVCVTTVLARRALAAYSAWGTEIAQTLGALTGARSADMAGAPPVPVADRIHTAVVRLAREASANAATARALADGAYHRAARANMPQDHVGVALARLTARMNDLAASANRMARGDVSRAVEPESAADAFGQAYADMTRRILATVRDAESSRVRMAATIAAMRGDVAALASSTTVDASRLRRTEERLAAAALQARADATRGAALTERAVDSEALLAEGSTVLHSSLDGLEDVLRRSANVQHLARNAGLLAVRAGGRRDVTSDDPSEHEMDARVLAADASETAGVITRMMIDGTERTYRAGVAFDRVALAARESTALVRELGAASHRRARSLGEIDDTVAHVHRTTARGADTARQLLQRLDALSSQARRLEVVLRGAAPDRGTVIRAMRFTAGLVKREALSALAVREAVV